MGFQIVIKISGGKDVNREALAKQLANVLESFTGVRTMVRVQKPSGIPIGK